MPDRLVSWNRLDLQVRGDRILRMARSELAARRLPVEVRDLRFRDGVIEMEGILKKGFSVPFSVVVREILASEGGVVVPFADVSVLGFLPVPRFLFSLAEGFSKADGITIDPARQAIFIALDRFLPPFVDLEIDSIRIVDGGLAVTLGPGGADPPQPGGSRG
ncbi:MAG: hypothetical protein LC732_00385 [Acidobacteria bacterium]|nr:hypothetical protein [Acidobacteriota bacterium]